MTTEEVCESEPLNVRLRCKTSGLRLVPRQYQSELYQKALNQNVVICLGTGLGKTFIMVLYLNSPLIHQQIAANRRVVFMAPTQDLVKQQAEYINKQVDHTVKIFCGRSAHCGEHIDHWDRNVWDKELAKVQILFMTPQILASAISTNLLDWTQFAAVIFDECHHASKSKKNKVSGGHPYAQILDSYRSFYEIRPDSTRWPRPRLIGLTASLINRMPKNHDSIRDGIAHLERVFQASCVTDFNVQETKPTVVIQNYTCFKLGSDNDLIAETLLNFVNRMKIALELKKIEILFAASAVGKGLTKEETRVLAFHNRLRMASAGFSIRPTSFPTVVTGLCAVRLNCGLWSLRAVCEKLIEAVGKHGNSTFLTPELRPIYQHFTEILKLIHSALDKFFIGQDIRKQLLSYTRPKCKALLEILKREYERIQDGTSDKSSFSCIIFVRSRLEVVALNLWLQRVSSSLPEFSFIKCNYALGIAATMTSKYSCITKRKATEQSRMLADFREGILNVIVTTSVLEEGIDLPVCSTVIRYDKPNTFREFVQSRGRARQRISSFIFLTEDIKQPEMKENLDKLHDFEVAVKNYLSDKGSLRELAQTRRIISYDELDEDDFFLARENSVRISSSTARTILNIYCTSLSKLTPYTEGVRYERQQPSSVTFQTTLFLPSGCPIGDGIRGKVKSDERLADNSAVIAVVKALYENGELDERGVPVRVNEKNTDKLLASQNLEPKFETLSAELEGTSYNENDKNVFLYEPKARQIVDYLSRDFKNRRYKLIQVRFISDRTNSRPETRQFFEKSTFGIIVDANVPDGFVPSILWSHYGQFTIESQLVQANFIISRREDHQEYLSFTHKLLTRCLSLRCPRRDELMYHLLFYMVALNTSGQPDFQKMRRSFNNINCRPRVGDIVKLRHHFAQSSRRDGNRPMLVRAIHHNLNAKSPIPGFERTTFLAESERNFSFRPEINQPVYELMPLSREFSQAKVCKKVAVSRKSREEYDYSTRSIYYLEQFLEFFDSDPSAVFQAYNLPEIVYRLYLYSSAKRLDDKFLNDTAAKRQVPTVSAPSGQPIELEISEDERAAAKNVPVQDDSPSDVSEESESENESDEEYEGDLEPYDTDYSDEELQIGLEYEMMIKKRRLNLNDDGDDDHMEKWDLSEYKNPNMIALNYEQKHYYNPDTDSESRAQFDSNFYDMKTGVALAQEALIDKLDSFKLKLTDDKLFLDDEAELSKRTAKVDRTIVPPIKFDRNFKLVPGTNRVKGLLEALTQKRAQEAYNLESLENIGDSYLKYMVSVVLFKRFQGNEGFLTAARSRLTCNNYFTHLAKKSDLGAHAITQSFSKDRLSFLLGHQLTKKDELPLLNKLRPKNLADMFESIIGSYLIYNGDYDAWLAMEWLGLDIFDETMFQESHERALVFTRAPTALVESSNENLTETYSACKKRVRKFEDIIDYRFNDASYLIQAFTHASCALKITRSYERFEFLGDAILDYLITMNLKFSGSMNEPGQLTSSRSALVNNCAFAKLALRYKYDLYIQHCNHEIYDELCKLRAAMEDDPEAEFLDLADFDRVVKLLADVFESVAGAIYLDSGCSLDSVWSVYYPMMKESIDQEILVPTKNLIANLYETFPGSGRIAFETFDVKTTEGPLVGVRCKIDGLGQFQGQGLSKSQAKMRAIRLATNKLPSKEKISQINQEYQRKCAPRMPTRNTRGGRGRHGGFNAHQRPSANRR